MGGARFGLPFIWVSWLCGSLSGEDHCEYSGWFRAHFTFQKADSLFDTVGYNTLHKELLNRRADELKADGWAVTKESQNAFKLKGSSALLAGKPDIVAVKGNAVRIVDAKTGQRRNAHWYQVVIYIMALKKLRSEFNGMKFEGELCYATGDPVMIAASEITPDVMDRIYKQVRLVAFDMPPEKVPSESECGFCPIPKEECPERLATTMAIGETDEF